MPYPEHSAQLIQSAASTRPVVFGREHWEDDWSEIPYLYPHYCEWVAPPKIGTATVVWDYGAGARIDELSFGTVGWVDRFGWWIKIEIPQTELDGNWIEQSADPVYWVGRVVSSKRREVGTPKRQILQCRGLETILEDIEIRQSWVDNGSSGDRRIAWGLEFNAPDRAKPATGRQDSIGNRSESIGPDGVYRFAGPAVAQLESAERWTTYEIVRYLLEYHTPRNSSDAQPIQLDFDPVTGRRYLYDWDFPRVPTHGRTLKAVLDAIVDRRRGLGYAVEYDDAADAVRVRFFNYLPQNLTLPSGEVLDRSDELVNLPDAFRHRYIRELDIEKEQRRAFDQVRAIGRPIEFVATLKATADPADTTIVAGWSTQTETDYDTAASGEAGYGSLNRAEKQQRNRDYRAQDKFARVYSHFQAAAGWPEQDDGQPWSNPIAPDLYTGVGLDPAADWLFYRPMLRFLPRLALREQTDYSVYPPDDNLDSTLTFEYLRPFAIFKLPDELASASGKYALADSLAAGAGIEGLGAGPGRDFSCGLRVQESAAGIVLRVHGYPQQAIAAADFIPADDTDTSDAIPEYDWRDELIVTVGMAADCHLEARYPDPVTTTDPTRVFTIDASSRCAGIVLPSSTVLGVDPNGDLIDSGGGKWPRDDRPTLEDLARLAWDWYGGVRQKLVIGYVGVNRPWFRFRDDGDAATVPKVGDLITTIGTSEDSNLETVNTAITSIRMQFARRPGATHTTRITTQWAELEMMQVI